ncbi:glycosyltransferase family 4 protein [Calothrix sp. PCC 7507]|uniref:glycosyltransferase family 4 protein n=1 Tax=Calothrix sp. PCC 7507 TaxID=99598 RepID=UPI00029F0159|nr:glycosyltransferase family 4 protein [Calothrix sp. PCC 7507]AFY32697.1 glycosyl transferase group 1 [Calothrix sp. PCC 7507]
MKVLYLANFPQADQAWERWKTGQKRESPEHGLWGATHLHNYGIETDLLPYEKYTALKKISRFLKLGDIDLQFRAFLALSKYDLVYSSSQTGTLFLAFLRAIGILRKPVVVKLERPFNVNFLTKIILPLFARGHDKILCLSSRVENQLHDEFGIPKSKLALLDWGPDLPSYDEEKQGQSAEMNPPIIISAGNISRDYNSLAEAVRNLNCSVHIYCSKSSAPTIDNLPEQVKCQYKHPTATTALTWQDLVMKYEKSYAVAIPLEIPESRVDNTPLYGLTSLLDAMAMGKAVIMTYHRQVNIDVVKEGIGLWVEPGDVKGWEKAIAYLLDHPEETEQMGKRALQLAKEKYNLDTFSSQLAVALKSTIKQ